MNLTDIKQDTPRLVVTFGRDAAGNEQFGFGMVGSIPPLSLIGYLARIRSILPGGDHLHSNMRAVPVPQWNAPPALVVAWDAAARECSWFVGADVPTDPLVGFLELVGAMLVDTQLAAMAQAARGGRQVGIVGPDGRPINRGMFGM